MKINWTVRLKNKVFWMTIIPAMLLLVTRIAAVFGIMIDLSAVGENLVAVVEAAFVVLAALGIVVDMTTDGMSDSKTAMTYTEPKKE